MQICLQVKLHTLFVIYRGEGKVVLKSGLRPIYILYNIVVQYILNLKL